MSIVGGISRQTYRDWKSGKVVVRQSAAVDDPPYGRGHYAN